MLVEVSQHSWSARYRLDVDPLAVLEEVRPAETDLVLDIEDIRRHLSVETILLSHSGCAVHSRQQKRSEPHKHSEDPGLADDNDQFGHFHGFSLAPREEVALVRRETAREALVVPTVEVLGHRDERDGTDDDDENRNHETPLISPV
ncbi:MAG: hypothetical protein QG566_723 [Patescibacteria group bacterium]|nr:hypothetical protein [Patescibacteria group bacterium]